MLLTALQLVGLPWVGLFAVSKTVQTYRNLRWEGFTAAVQRIAQGKGNCSLCRKVRVAQAQERQQPRDVESNLQWTPAILPASVTVRPLLAAHDGLTEAAVMWVARAEPPPFPPPRLS